MQTEADARIITCILPAGNAHRVLEKLYEEKQVTRTGVYHARGVGSSVSYRSSFVESTEKDVLVAVVKHTRAEEIFEYLYEVTEIYQPHRGFMYMQRLSRATPFVIPD